MSTRIVAIVLTCILSHSRVVSMNPNPNPNPNPNANPNLNPNPNCSVLEKSELLNSGDYETWHLRPKNLENG